VATPRPTVIALGGIVLISFSAILVRTADVAPPTSVFYRCAYALPLLALLAWRRPGHGGAGPALASGVLLGADLLLWHHAIEEIGAGLSTVLANTQVLFMAAIGAIWFGIHPTRATLVALAAMLAGVGLIGGIGGPAATRPSLAGVVEGIAAAATYAGFLLLFERAAKLSGSLPYTLALCTAACCAVAFAAVLAEGASFRMPLEAHLWLALLAITSQVLGWLLIWRGLALLGAITASVLLVLQPVCTAIWGVLLLDEELAALQVVGITLVLGGVWLARTGRLPFARGRRVVHATSHGSD
jgi:drug/metabolite transporter (DMT)-like permease